MKTVNYILRDESERSAGRLPGRRVLPPGEGKVVDLAAWKEGHLAVPDRPGAGRVSALERNRDREPVRRRRKSTAVQDRAELAATLAVAAAFVALIVRVLLF